MKTLAEFIHRLQHDAAFEKRARAFDHGDDLIAFAKLEGYDFTLEQLMNEFESGETPPPETGDLATPLAGVSPPPSPRPDAAEFPGQPEAVSGPERDTALLERKNPTLTGEPPEERSPPPQGLPPLGPEAGPHAGLFGGSGGRHRGFSPQRLKSVSEEDS